MAKIKQALDDFRPDSRLVDERGPTRERERQAGGDIFYGDGRHHTRDSPIERAVSNNQISRPQYNAAQKYYAHYFHGGLIGSLKSPELTMVFGGFGPREGLAHSENQLFHRDRASQAERIMGRRSWIMHDLVFWEKSFEAIGRRMGWQNRPQAVAAAVTEARSLLDALCDAWGIIK